MIDSFTQLSATPDCSDARYSEIISGMVARLTGLPLRKYPLFFEVNPIQHQDRMAYHHLHPRRLIINLLQYEDSISVCHPG